MRISLYLGPLGWLTLLLSCSGSPGPSGPDAGPGAGARDGGANGKPVALLSPLFQADVFSELELDGSRSYDPDGDPLTYFWTIGEKPPGSQATLRDSARPKAYFRPDRAGLYRI